jgi:hypothetical protein
MQLERNERNQAIDGSHLKPDERAASITVARVPAIVGSCAGGANELHAEVDGRTLLNESMVNQSVDPNAVAPTIGKYRVLGTLAKGGMGEILLARHEGIEGFAKTVVIKRILETWPKAGRLQSLKAAHGECGSTHS